MSILITGGTGFIGSHTIVELLGVDRDLVVVDNFSNSKPVVLDRIKQITGKDFKFYQADLLDYDAVEQIFKENKIDGAIHSYQTLHISGEGLLQLQSRSGLTTTNSSLSSFWRIARKTLSSVFPWARPST